MPPRGTRQHPVWCVTRQDWVGLGELLPGEEVETRQGPLAVRTVQDVPGLQSVYNLEVHGEHVYEVTDAGILVHNNNSAACLDFASLQRRIDLGEVLEGDDLANYARLLNLLAPPDGTAYAHRFKPGVTLGPDDEAWINTLRNRMNKKGWQGGPIVVHTLPDGTMEILDGHHRVAAAIRSRNLGEIPWREATPQELDFYRRARQ